MSTLAGIIIDRRQKLQKSFITIEFSAFDLCRVSNFIKTEALVTFAQNYGLKDDRYQYWQKTIVTIEFTTLDLCRVRNFIKIEVFAVLRPKLWLKSWQVCQHWQVPRITENSCHQWIQHLQIVHYAAPSLCSIIQHLQLFIMFIMRSPFPVIRSSFPVPLFKDSF